MYEKMYFKLFDAIDKAMELMEWQEYQAAPSCLEQACLDAEEIYVTFAPDLAETTESSPASICCPMWCLQEEETL